jgi:5,10-methylenetetrahydrofolate reductase
VADRNFSFEFYPPKTPEGAQKLRTTWKQLGQLNPQFFSVTFGAGGSTREGTLGTVLEIRKDGHAAAPHISCIASSRDDLRKVIHEYKDHGIRHIVALRGDMPSGLAASGDFRYASELVKFIREEVQGVVRIFLSDYERWRVLFGVDLKKLLQHLDRGAETSVFKASGPGRMLRACGFEIKRPATIRTRMSPIFKKVEPFWNISST